jgi:predicted transport protein
MKSAIFMNGNKFNESVFSSEEVFEKIVKENSKTLFGAKSIYFDIKSKVDSKTFGSAIPDGFLFDFKDEENPEFYLIEVELQRHDFYNHIFPQITKFFAFFKNQTSRNNLIEKLHSFIRANDQLEQEFKKYLGKREIYKALKDVIENSQNIMIVLDDDKPEMQEVFDTYTDTWDKIVKVEILKQYTTKTETIFTLNPDFEDIALIEEPTKQTEREGQIEKYTEAFHLDGVNLNIVKIYEAIKISATKIDPEIKVNPQHYYISLRKNKNFAYIKIKKTKMDIVIVLPYEVGSKFITKHRIQQLSQGIQDWYGYPCFSVTLENQDNFDEIVKALEEAYRKQT